MTSPCLAEHVGDLITSAQSADRAAAELAAERLMREIDPWMRARARRLRPDLALRGLADDVAQEAHVLLLTRPAGHYSADRGTPEGYLITLLQNAAKTVEASYAMPGHTVRRKQIKQGRDVQPHVHLDAHDVEVTDRVLTKTSEWRAPPQDEVLQNLAIEQVRRELPLEDSWVASVIKGVLGGTPSLDRFIVPGVSRHAVRRRSRSHRPLFVRAGLLRR